ncbi:MAG: hypothetical protein JNL67_12700 [Planctomycetaceae bacterium]|nr:hypothetical protein [Planctomycetaceae bacterium]
MSEKEVANRLPASDPTRVPGYVRFMVYTLLLVSSFSCMVVRLGWTQRQVGEEWSPMLSANDRSRWVTVRALVETGSYAIDPYTKDPDLARHWNTIDKVVHEGPDGRLHEYSSKPPLLATMIAGVYASLNQVGWLDMEASLFLAVRWLLLLCQIIPLVVTFGVLAWFLDRWPLATDAARFYAFAAACWGTFVTTFAVTLNNHHFAVIAVYWSLFAICAIQRAPFASGFWYVILGLGGGMAFANELPALAWTAGVVAIGLWFSPERAIRWMLPAILVVGLAYFGTNLIAHRTLRMPYSFRSDGPVALTLPMDFAEDLEPGLMPTEMRRQLNRHSSRWGFELGPETWIEDNQYELSSQVERRWVIRNYFLGPYRPDQWQGLAVVQRKGADSIEIRQWANWYDFPGSYWHDGRRAGVDIGESSPGWYAFHCLIGHHGIFSLTPMWLVSCWGILLALKHGGQWRTIAMMVLGLSVVVIGFYLTRTELDRNYGGQASALRWVFWITPFWVLMLVPAINQLRRSGVGLTVAWVLLALSAGSALYSGTNPWVHPWLYEWSQTWFESS